jgi:hypothetical protein
MCTCAWPSVRTPIRSTRSRSWARVIGPSASAATTSATARSASSGGTFSWASRRVLAAASGGVVSACSHQ